MSIFRSQYRVLAEDLSTQLAEMRMDLEIERNRRVTAEALAEDRAQQIEQVYVLLSEANKERAAANADRLKSLDLVNTALLNQHGPEKETRNIKDYHAVPKDRLNAVVEARKADRLFVTGMLKRMSKPAASPPAETKTQ